MPKQAKNPFYVLLVVVGIVFCITACAYGVMTVRRLDPMAAEVASQADGGLMQFLDAHGFAAMLVELAVLGTATVAAIATDSYWMRPPRRATSATARGRERESA